MIFTVRTTTGREKIVAELISAVIKNHNIPLKSILYTEDLRGYLFIEGMIEDIEKAIKDIPNIRGIIRREISLSEIERFIVPEKREIELDIEDIVEVIGGPFKGEKAKITRVDKNKNEITVELLESAIPIPVTISVNTVRLYEKHKKAA